MSKSVPALAPLIPYSVPSIPSIYSVEGALDHLFYQPITSSISVTPSIEEVGATVTSVVLNWSISREPSTSITITDIPLINVSQTTDSVTLNSLTLTTNKTYSLSVVDNGNTTGSSATLQFLFLTYWGQTSNANPDNIDVLNFSYSDFKTSRVGSYTYTNLINEYIYLAFPSSFGVPVFTVNGLIVTFQSIALNGFVNASEGITDYVVYKSNNLLNGSVTISVS
jgi:hypothetical protein